MRLSVLDQSPIPEGSTAADALRNTLDLARLADELGYHRYWLAEHHGGPMLAGPAPEALIPPIAAATSRIRVGSGGVMLPHYSPFKVAEAFTLLAALYPGRIDLGLGRAPGPTRARRMRSSAIAARPSPDDFPQQLAELLGYLDGTLPADHPFASLTRCPAAERPEVWLLGSSPQSRIWANEGDLRYAFADFINPDGATSRSPSRPTRVAVWVICAETEEEAQRLAASSRMTFSHAAPRPADPGPAAGEGAALPGGLRVVVEPRAPRGHRGSRPGARAGVEEVAQAYGADGR